MEKLRKNGMKMERIWFKKNHQNFIKIQKLVIIFAINKKSVYKLTTVNP